MSLDLDPRQRAMLQEMGVTVWWPSTALDPTQSADGPSPAPSASPFVENIATNNVSVRVLPADKKAGFDPNFPPPPPANPTVVAKPIEGLADMGWHDLQQTVATCRACGLCAGRKNAVFGSPSGGPSPSRSPRADWLIVGDGPSESDDATGDIFTGEAGVLLDNMLKAIGLARSAVALTHAIKCRPSGGRSPDAQELAQCGVYLQRQIEWVQPKMILAMGRVAAAALLQAAVPDVAAQPLGKLRGQVHQIPQAKPQGDGPGVAQAVVVTYPPATLLRSPADKAKAWADLCLAMAAVNAMPDALP